MAGADVAVPSISIATPTAADTVLGVQESGAVKRFLVAKIGEAVGPLIGRAQGVYRVSPSGDATGVADKTAYDAAYALAVAAGGGIIELASGTFYTKNTFAVIHDNIYIRGSGKELTKIVAVATWASEAHANGATMAAVVTFCGVSNFGVSGLTVDAVTNSITVNGIAAIPDATNGTGTPCDNGYIINCGVRLGDAHNYHIWSQRAQRVRIEGNTVDGGVTTYNATSKQEGIEVYGGRDVLIRGNFVKNVGAVGIPVGTGASLTPLSEAVRVSVIDNIVVGCGKGLLVQPTYDATNGDCGVYDVIVAHNRVSGCWLWGITLDIANNNSTASGVQISHNLVRGPSSGGQAASRGIRLFNSGTSAATVNLRNILVSHNDVIDIPHTDSNGPISVYRFSNFRLNNNVARQSPSVTGTGAGRGYWIYGCKSFEVIDCEADGARYFAVEVTASSGFTFRGMRMFNYNKAGAGVAAMMINPNVTDFEIIDPVIDLDTVTNEGAHINLGSAGIDRFLVKGVRYRGANGTTHTQGNMSFNAGRTWVAGTAYVNRSVVRPTAPGAFYYVCVTAGTSHATTEPTWPTSEGATVTDGTVTWVARSIH